jgi:DNA-binding response OmpR family regulator
MSEAEGVQRVLIVEDDDAIAEPLAHGLEREGYAVTRVATGRAALDHTDVDLVLLDLGLPDLDGYEVCRQIRARASTPIIVITARGDEVDKVVGLELGADDYVVKPFGYRELVARIRAVGRRMAAPEHISVQHIGAIAIDHRKRKVWSADAEVALAPKEFDLLALLADDAGAVVSRQQIVEQVWDPHWYGPTKTLDVHVATLRKKLGQPQLIETVRGVGFRLAVEP